MTRALLVALLALLLPGCLLLPPDQIFPLLDDDDDSAGDDDDVANDDDAADDDDSASELPPCAFDADLPGAQDGDADGWPAESAGDGGAEPCDCDDADATRYPGAPELRFDLTPEDCDATVEVLTGTDTPAVAGTAGLIGPPNTSTFGSAVSWGHFGGEAAADVCVRSGAWVYVLYDPTARLGDDGGQQPVEGAIGPLAPFGSVDCAHDVDGDGTDDIVVNAYGGGTGAARGVFVYSGASLPTADFVIDDTDADHDWDGGSALPLGTTVGTCLGLGNLEASGAGVDEDEILVGTDGSATIGYAVLRVTGSGVEVVDQWSRAAIQTPDTMDCFVVGDLDSRGLDEMVLGDPDAGTRIRFTEDGFGGTQPNDVEFTFRVRAALSLDTDGDDDLELALGVAGAEFGGNSSSGMVGLIRGGLTTGQWAEVPNVTGDVLFNRTHAITFVDDLESAGLGRALCAVGDLDADGSDDLVMTAPRVGSTGVGEARVYTGRLWERWAESLNDDLVVPRGTETTRFEAPGFDDGFGAMSRCSAPGASRASHVFFGAPALAGSDTSSGGIYWWANETAAAD